MVDDATLHQLSLSRDEYGLILERLGREPNAVELGMFGALWSEHCGYKNSRPLLSLLPTQGEHVLTKAGEENAGAVDIGDGWLVAMKIESHNHPSAIEPYQGAATGVGGIVRDIFAMGARPVALLDSLRFGPIAPEFHEQDPERIARSRYLFGGVVAGIGGYGNTLGLPTIGGEAYFEPAYAENPLVNAMCIGIARHGTLIRARADGPGNLLMLVGADTGRDGIHGATFASVELDESSEERRPAVQVGNPLMEKLLIDACLTLLERGRDWVVGLQDLGAAGLTSSAVECAARAGTGLVIDVENVPRREAGMTPYEVMLSESQERMLVIVRRGFEDEVRQLFEHWDLHCAVIGEVTDDGLVRIHENGDEVAVLPVGLLTEPPQYRRRGVAPDWLAPLQDYDLSTIPDLVDRDARPADPGGRDSAPAIYIAPPVPGRPDGFTARPSTASLMDAPMSAAAPAAAFGAEAALIRLLSAPNIASRRWIYRQYDHQVLTNTVVPPGGDAAVIRIKGTSKAIAASTDGNGRLCHLDPFTGGAIAVAEAARNVVCTGAIPVAITNCLNFGNPEKPEIYFQLEQAIRGIAAACEALETPVISGNVSLYNETLGDAIYPTPVIGMLGVIEDVSLHTGAGFVESGDDVWLVGGSRSGLAGDVETLAGSEYARTLHGVVAGRPRLDLDREKAVQRVCSEGIRRGIIRSAHDCADGGLAVALAESAIQGGIGFEGGAVALSGRLDAVLFGEEQSRIVVTCAPAGSPGLRALADERRIHLTFLGRTGGDRFRLGQAIDLPLAEIARAYDSGIEAALSYGRIV
jgi:phosphoribosylformylglycinamidine (FGAM) synthase-like enzyme